jgi:hypothetical protein
MKRALKFVVRRVLGDYELFNIFRCAVPVRSLDRTVDMVEISADHCRRSRHPEIQNLAGYAGEGARGFGLLDEGELVCACWYWYGERYALNRGFWRLEENDAKLVQITTAEVARGKSFAKILIASSSQSMRAAGFERLFARIWFGHTASERAFRAVGWQRIATVFSFNAPFGDGKMRLQWPPERLMRRRGD